MAATATGSSRRSPNGPVLRSISPSGRFHFPTPSSSSTAFAYSSSSFTSRSSTFFNRNNHHQNQLQRSASPTRVSLYGNTPSTPSVRFSTVNSSRNNQVVRKQSNTTVKKSCMCSPTTHPGSFRCSLHKNLNSSPQHTVNHNRLNARRSAMTNSLVRIGGVEGDLVKRALAALIRPSSHQQRRRAGFQPRPSRLSVMSTGEQ